MILLKALLLGILEGITEFLPVSSTGHLIIASDLLNYPAAMRATFEIFIQVGAILAVFWHYRTPLLELARRIPREAEARSFVGRVALAFLPAAVVGVLLHHKIETYLFGLHPVAAAFIVGGVIIILVERSKLRVRVSEMENIGWRDAFWVGVAQVTSLFPGVSRAGATIIGGLLVGLGRPAATQFSFYLALPTVSAASLFSLAKSFNSLSAADFAPLAVGLVSAFVSALLVIRAFLTYVQSHDLKVFGYYRIVAGILILLFL